MTPLVDGQVHSFEFRGLYDGVSILGDRETGTIWHHITGEAMYGPLRGKVLLPVSNALQMTVAEALVAFPDIPVAISDRPIRGEEHRFGPWLARIPLLGDAFRRTMAPEDTRRPTMDIGLAIWNDRVQRYYPMEVIGANDNVIIDELDGRRVAIFYAIDARAPAAVYVDARSASWNGRVLTFDNGYRVEAGLLYDAQGVRTEMRRPLQMFTRWYGYALTFPKTEVYGLPKR